MLTSKCLSKRLLRSAVTQISPSRAGSTNNWFPRTPGQKRHKVDDHMYQDLKARVWLNFVPLDGVPRRVPAWPNDTLLKVMHDYQIPDLGNPNFPPHEVPVDWYSEGPACGQCQVMIPKQWNDKIYFGEKEQDCLKEQTQNANSFSRLACCIAIRPVMNEMIVYSMENEDPYYY